MLCSSLHTVPCASGKGQRGTVRSRSGLFVAPTRHPSPSVLALGTSLRIGTPHFLPATPHSCRRPVSAPHAAKRGAGSSADDNETEGDFLTKYGSNISFGLIWAALLGYAILFSPNQTPLRDQYFLEKLVRFFSDFSFAFVYTFINFLLTWLQFMVCSFSAQ